MPLAASHALCFIAFLLSLNTKYFIISSVICDLIHWLFRSILLSFQILVDSLVIFLLFISRILFSTVRGYPLNDFNPVTSLRFDLFSRTWPITELLIFDPFGRLVVNVGSWFSCLCNCSFLCHSLGCGHPFPLFIVEPLQFILHVINQILCTFHMTFFFFTTSKAHLSWVIAFSVCIIILFSYLAPFSFSHPSSFLTCCLILYMPVKNMNDFILVFLSLHILCSALNQRNTNPFVVYRHLKNRVHIKVL